MATSVADGDFVDAFTDGADAWVVVTTIVDDPIYLATPFITSSSFKKESDTSKWNPSACQTDAPR